MVDLSIEVYYAAAYTSEVQFTISMILCHFYMWSNNNVQISYAPKRSSHLAQGPSLVFILPQLFMVLQETDENK